jgi:hypothetical protein
MLYADMGDLPWDGVIPQAVQQELKDAKGKVYEMGSDPWWCVSSITHGLAALCRLSGPHPSGACFYHVEVLFLLRPGDMTRSRRNGAGRGSRQSARSWVETRPHLQRRLGARCSAAQMPA